MRLNPIAVYDYLTSIGITHLYHANTVKTSCTFLRTGGLLSRGAVEHFGLVQTPQSSDEIDKRYNVWNDIFLDSVDLHGGRFPRQNLYGPVLFKIKLNVLRHPTLPELWVTKDNPTRWYDGQVDSERYMNGIEEFKTLYANGSYKEMITIRNTYGFLPFDSYLEEIILDDPQLRIVSDGRVFFDEAAHALKDAMKSCSYNLDNVTRTRRICNIGCYCRENYKGFLVQELSRLFFN
ncbi:hypothetical protein [Paenibacillus validus]|uniref:hypothetical protein n=1 Tax=Paenibacillus validus TaxID=44253 RepID=UPI003D2A3E12